jgi:hypothetical protein
MTEKETTSAVSNGSRIAGWIISILPVLLLLMSASFKFLQPGKEFADGLEHLGWSSEAMLKLGFVEIACTLIYLVPRTSMLGAILLTAYLGGAVATHVRIGDPFWAPVLAGVAVWLGLWLRDQRIKALIPLRS